MTAAVAAMVAAPPPASATIQLGAYIPRAPGEADALTGFAAKVGRQPDIVMWYREFGQPFLSPVEMANLRATGQTPMLTWEPYNHSLAGIAAGDYDAYLHESAALAMSWGAPLMVRFAHEMNGDWYPWSTDPSAAATYLAAWRHVVSLFRADGATNVRWVWSPYAQSGSRYPIAPYFPGDEWIDYTGIDGYNWGGAIWRSLEEVFTPSYSVVTTLSAKPIIISETSSSELGGDKAAWIRTGFMATIPRSFPRVNAVVWFDDVQPSDWRIDTTPASLEAYRAVVACSFYGGTGPCDGAAQDGKARLILRSVRVPRRVSGRRAVAGSVSYVLSQFAEVRIRVLPRRNSARGISIVRRGRPGRNRVPLARIFRRRHLHVGRYRVVVTARNGDARSRSRRAHFRVVGAAGRAAKSSVMAGSGHG